MSRKYKFRDAAGVYFVTYATIHWIDVFSRPVYKDILVDSINHCIKEKGLVVYAWVIMTNHLHMIISTEGQNLENILRDLKKFTSKAIVKEVEENPQESRKEWMLWMFERAGNKLSHNSKYQFWQQHNQPIALHTKDDLERKLNYIHNNPVVARFVDHEEDYPYSSAVDYAGQKGMIDVVNLY